MANATLPSARRGFTSEFGKGSGGSLLLLSPANCCGAFGSYLQCIHYMPYLRSKELLTDQLIESAFRCALYLAISLNQVQSTCCCRLFGLNRLMLDTHPTAWVLYSQASRAISIGQLHTSPCFHTQPINVLVSNGSLEDIQSQGNLILRQASRLDAFSGYPFRTQLPGDATGVTTGTPEVRPLWSSRTRSRSSQISSAHGRQGPNCLTTF